MADRPRDYPIEPLAKQAHIEDQMLVSLAISAKRIADALDRLATDGDHRGLRTLADQHETDRSNAPK